MKGEILDGAGLRMAPSDNVATALDDLQAGTAVELDDRTVTLAEDVPFGHKFALEAVGEGDRVRKYGEVIGQATRHIDPGEWVHTHNCESTRGRGDLAGAESNGGETA